MRKVTLAYKIPAICRTKEHRTSLILDISYIDNVNMHEAFSSKCTNFNTFQFKFYLFSTINTKAIR